MHRCGCQRPTSKWPSHADRVEDGDQEDRLAGLLGPTLTQEATSDDDRMGKPTGRAAGAMAPVPSLCLDPSKNPSRVLVGGLFFSGPACCPCSQMLVFRRVVFSPAVSRPQALGRNRIPKPSGDSSENCAAPPSVYRKPPGRFLAHRVSCAATPSVSPGGGSHLSAHAAA